MCPPDQLSWDPWNYGPSTRQTPGARPSTRRSTDYALLLWCVGTRSPTCTPLELGTDSGLVLHQPKPGPQFTGPGLGANWSIYVVTGGT